MTVSAETSTDIGDYNTRHCKVVERKQPRWNQQPTSTSLYNNMLFANALYQQPFACTVYGFLRQQHDKEFVSIRYSVDVQL